MDLNPFNFLRILRIKDAVVNAINTGLSLKNITDIFHADDLPYFENLGATMFPKLAPKFHAAAAIVSSYNHNYVMWIQGALNNLVVPSPKLAVDGYDGPRTRAAIEAFQKQLGFEVNGWAGDIERAAIGLALSKLQSASLKALPPDIPKA